MSAGRAVAASRRAPLRDGWTVALAPAGTPREAIGALDWLPAQVPGTAAGALRVAGRWSWDTPLAFDALDAWWRVRLPASHGRFVLGFDGLATLAEAWLDGEPLLSSANMFLAHEVELDLDGTHELLLRCRALAPELAQRRPRPRWRVPMLVEQNLRAFRTSLLGRTPGWSPPCPAVGPWREVWLEPAEGRAGGVHVEARLEDVDGIVDVALALAAGTTQATLVATRGDHRSAVELQSDGTTWRGEARIAGVERWWPHTHGEPALYDLHVEAVRDGVDERLELGATGFRTIAVDRSDGGFALRVNDVSVFCRGACWTPLDVVTLDATDEAFDEAVRRVRDAGFNMLRVSGATVYENDAFHDALDRHGILLWQDLMFANMDYPDDEACVEDALRETRQLLDRLQARPSVAIVCGNSEVAQQAAMSGAPREAWTPALFHEHLALPVIARGHVYVPSSTHGGAFPQASDGVTSYYGVGAYRRGLEDARRGAPAFASECLAFANVPADDALPAGGAVRAPDPRWTARVPRDLGAGWDFDDVRDHYVEALYGVDAAALRARDHERYLALGRAATGEVMARTFAEWRRARSRTQGALVWFLHDLWPGAGWGLVDALGRPKACLHALRRVLAPVAVTVTDEGLDGLAIHVHNDRPEPLRARVAVTLHRDGGIVAGRAGADVEVPAHASIELAAAALFDTFVDLAYAYRFGPPVADVVHVALVRDDMLLSDTFAFPDGMGFAVRDDVGLAVEARRRGDEIVLAVSARTFAQSVMIDVPGHVPHDEGFHLAPGQSREIVLRAVAGVDPAAPLRGVASALNARTRTRFTLA